MAKKTTAPKHWSVNYGPEKLDPTPVEMPVGFHQPKPLAEMMREFLKAELADRDQEELETFEEANDFADESDELMDMSAYQFTDMDEEWPISSPEDPTQGETDSEPAEELGRGEESQPVGDSESPPDESETVSDD